MVQIVPALPKSHRPNTGTIEHTIKLRTRKNSFQKVQKGRTPEIIT